MYSIGQVSAMTNLPISTLRYYDKEGFFPNLEKQSGIRRFSQAELDANEQKLLDGEKEIRENYASNITLKSLSEKYYVNSAYLGQLFRKKYGQSFKDYLNNYRMEQAADALLRTDKKIVQIAEDVGYHDLDYFTNRFIQIKGCTPARFRKKMQQGE